MNTKENNGAPPAGGFGAPTAPDGGQLPFGPTGGWGQMQVAVPPPLVPGVKMASLALYFGIASIPGIFLCSAVALPLAVAAVALGIASLYRMKGQPRAANRGSAIVGLVCGGVALTAIATFFAYFVFFGPGFR